MGKNPNIADIIPELPSDVLILGKNIGSILISIIELIKGKEINVNKNNKNKLLFSLILLAKIKITVPNTKYP